MYKLKRNKDENVHRFALSAIRGDLLEGEREKKRERDSFGILYTGYLFIVKIKREIERERERERGKREGYLLSLIKIKRERETKSVT